MRKLWLGILAVLTCCAMMTCALAEEVLVQPDEVVEPIDFAGCEGTWEVGAGQVDEAVPEQEEFTLGEETDGPIPPDEVCVAPEEYAVEAPMSSEPEWDGSEADTGEQAVMAAATDFTIDGTTLKKYNGNDANVVIPDGVTVIGSNAFKGNIALQSVIVPNGVTVIQDYAFKECAGLREVSLPESLVEIGPYVFCQCIGLQSITIPSNVEKLSGGAFKSCSGMRFVTLQGSKLKTINSSCFAGCSNLESINLPDSVAFIGETAFKGTNKLNTINLSNNLTEMGSEAFLGSGITSVTIPGSLKKIKLGAFQGCEQLSQLTLDEGIETIGQQAFSGCTSIKEISIPNSVTEMGDWVFSDCSRAQKLYIGTGLKDIPYSAFRDCKSLTTISIPDNITHIYPGAFAGTQNATTIRFSSNLTSMGSHPLFRGVFADSGVINIELPDKLVLIPEYAFSGCKKLEGVIISSSVTRISDYAFLQCPSLLYVVIPKSVTVFGTNVFGDNRSFTAYVEDNSYAYEYCEKNGIPHKRIGEPLPHNHVPVSISAVAPTCTQTGLTEGFRCSVCNEILKAQKKVPATGHNPVTIPGISPTCFSKGLTEGSYCSVCGITLAKQQTMAAIPHTPIIDPAVAPHYKVTGLTEGSHCAICGTILVAQHEVPALTTPEIVLSNQKSNGTVTLSMGEQRQFVPSFATSRGLTVTGYKSSKPKVASVNANGLVTAKAEGTAKITVKTGNKKVKATITVKVVDPYKPTGVSIAQGKSVTVNLGESLQLNASLAPATAQSGLTWKSSKKKVAAVDANGLVTPKAEGTTKITVTTRNKKKATITVKVVDPYKPTGVVISQGKTVTLKVGETLKLNATLTPAKAQSNLNWKSSKKKIASVDASGVVTARKKGTAKITVTTRNKKKTTITVKVVP